LFPREEVEAPPMKPIERVVIADILVDTLATFSESYNECVRQVRLPSGVSVPGVYVLSCPAV